MTDILRRIRTLLPEATAQPSVSQIAEEMKPLDEASLDLPREYAVAVGRLLDAEEQSTDLSSEFARQVGRLLDEEDIAARRAS